MSATGPVGAPPLGSTYRLQVQGIGFDGAAAVVPYLHALGIETLYLSPVLRAVAGSTHGYDVSDPTMLDPALGGSEAYRRLLDVVGAVGMRVLLDVVPNHLAASTDNPWWWDVLRLGRASPHAGVFDIDWATHAGRILLPVLGRPLDDVLAAGELSVERDERGPVLAYGPSRFPLDPATVDEDDPDAPGDLAGLLARQHYRLAYWRLGAKEGNYRRFFDVEGLVGVRVEEADVYAATHAVVLELVRDPRVAGLRVDHIDGLSDPAGYLRQLRTAVDSSRDDPGALLVEKILARGEQLPVTWPVEGTTGYEFADHAFAVLLAPDDPAHLDDDRHDDQPVGAPGPGPAVARLHEEALDGKRQMLHLLFVGQFAALVSATVAALGPEDGDDLARVDIAWALETLVVHLPVYRTYLDALPLRPEDDHLLTRLVAEAVDRDSSDESARALRTVADGLRRATGPGGDPAWRDVVRRYQQLSGALAAKGVEDTALYRAAGVVAGVDVGTPTTGTPVTVAAFHAWTRLRAGQSPGSLSTTSTHDAKRSEDVRARLCVLTELGDRWTWRQRRWDASDPVRSFVSPGGLRAFDVRVAYQATVGVWPDGPVDDSVLAGLRPRITEYLVKAAREAKVVTSWLEPDEGYEERLCELVETLLATPTTPFAEDVTRVVRTIGAAAATNSLALAALRICTPGVPDTYQGTETWARLLVDPDNRRPVPFDDLAVSLAGIDAAGRDVASFAGLLRAYGDGRIKQAVVSGLLRVRRERSDLFARGGYLPLAVEGPAAEHLVAFARTGGADPDLLVLVPRLPYRLAGPRRFPIGSTLWEGTRVVVPRASGARWTDVLHGYDTVASGGRLDVGSALSTLPVAVLASRRAS